MKLFDKEIPVIDILKVGGLCYLAYRVHKAVNPDNDNTLIEDCGAIDPDDLSYQTEVYRALADQFQQALYLSHGVFSEDDTAMADILMSCNTNADVLKLACEYGERSVGDDLFVWFFPPLTLFEATTQYLDTSDRDDVNADWLSKGITYILV